MSGTSNSVHAILYDPRVHRVVRDGVEWYSAAGVVEVLTESSDSAQVWQKLKEQEPALAEMATTVEFITDEEHQSLTATDGLTIDGVMRLVQSVSSPRAERMKRWLIESARQRMEEAEDPELALLRSRRLYERRGYSRRWIDKRLRGISTRQELTGEWYRRGAHASEDYRSLTNALFVSGFGKDVEACRESKGLREPKQNLRDHMTDLELTLLSLAEVTATKLHRARNSSGIAALTSDVEDAGHVIADAIAQIERYTGGPVTEARSQAA